MPKTKKQPKTTKLMNWFSSNSATKNILIFAVAFAAIGGGYMLYQSHAATVAINPYACTPAAYGVPQVVIRQGATGSCVKHLQWYLNHMPQFSTIGSSGPVFVRSSLYNGGKSVPYPLTIDGQFGSKTTAVAKSFQYFCGLTVDGVVGPKTWNGLFTTWYKQYRYICSSALGQ